MKKIASQFKKGFTILEMLMVLAIFGVLTAVIMFNYGEFNSRTIMTNMAYEVALNIREAQVYSLGVRGQVNLESFDNHYGVYFNKTANPKEYSFFIDKMNGEEEPDGLCDGGDIACLACAGGECLSKSTLTRDVTIDQLCISTGNDPVDSKTGSCNGNPVESLTVTFKRPNPDAVIYSGTTFQGNSSAGIVLTTSYGNKRAIIIRPTGQISVLNIYNPD